MALVSRLSFAAAFFGLTLFSSASAGLVPEARGNFRQGGLAPRWTKEARTPMPADWDSAEVLHSRSITAGGMRYVNNSGVCGTSLLLLLSMRGPS